MKKEIKVMFLLMLCGGLVYLFFEVLFGTIFNPEGGKSFRGLFSMFILGGVLFYLLGLINENKIIARNVPDYLQYVIAGLLITVSEFFAGLLLNEFLGWQVWDYSGYPVNIMGQVCLPFLFLWIALSPLAFFLDDFLRGVYTDIIQLELNRGK